MVENLRHLLSSYDSTKAHYLGSRRHSSETREDSGYNEGGCGTFTILNQSLKDVSFSNILSRIPADDRIYSFICIIRL